MSISCADRGCGSAITLGRSSRRRAITAIIRKDGARGATALILGGIHGNEPKSVYVCRKLIDLLQADLGVGAGVTWVIVPLVNPDGFEVRRRKNARGVDINRNFPTTNWNAAELPHSQTYRATPLDPPAAGRARRSRMYGGPRPGSEPETMAVIRAVERFEPAWIVTVHSIDRGRFCNNYDGPGRGLAMKMRRHNQYPVRGSIGYPTPGSFGTWAGAERGLPTITLELPSHHSAKRCWEDNRRALLCVP